MGETGQTATMQQAVQVLVDEPAIDREFTYLLPSRLASGRVPVTVGTVVQVPLHRRSIRGWVTGLDVAHPDGVELLAIKRVTSIGPPSQVIDLARWAAWRWAGTRVHFLRVASPERAVAGLPSAALSGVSDVSGTTGAARSADVPDWVAAAWESDRQVPGVVRLGPCADEWPLVAEALRYGRVLVLVPNVAWAAQLAGRLRREGVSVALAPRDWAAAAVAQAVVGTRSAAWAPCGPLGAVVVFDEHDAAYQSSAAPTWNARDVAVERARRDGARCLLVGPMPSLDALALCDRSDSEAGPTVAAAPRHAEREAWPRLQTADRRIDDPATGEWCGEALAEVLRSDAVVVCVLNRTGRARLAYCNSCGALAVSPRSGRALRQQGRQFSDPDTGEVRPAVCESCGATTFRRVRLGVKGVAEEMTRLALRPVCQVVGDTVVGDTVGGDTVADAKDFDTDKPPLYIGTEAVLHRVRSADVVAFVDFDQELMAPRYRAAEEAFALLVRAARLVGPRSAGGRILVQTRVPDHPVLAAAAKADPADWLRSEHERRVQMLQPPAAAWALVSGAAAPSYISHLSGSPYARELDIAGPADGTWRICCDEHVPLLDALARTERPAGRLRVAVDPMRA